MRSERFAPGWTTYVPGNAAITIDAVDGVDISGLIVDAGPVNSPVLFQIGKPNGSKPNDPTGPVTLNDVYFRIGGATLGRATTSLEVDHDSVILDDMASTSSRRSDASASCNWLWCK